MPIDIKSLREKRGTVKLYGGELVVEFHLHGRTTEEVTSSDEEREELTNAEATRRNIATFVSDRLISWNLTDGGEPVLLEPDVVLSKVPMSVMLDIIQAVNEELNPNPKRAKTS